MVADKSNTSPRFPPDIEFELRKNGWFPGRDVSDQLTFPSGKNVFPVAMDIFKEFGLLEICYDYQNCEGMGGEITMNVWQYPSEILLQNMSILEEALAPLLKKHEEEELGRMVKRYELSDVTMAERWLNVPCCYLGDFDRNDQSGKQDIYVTEFGEVYSGDFRDVYREADNFDEFLIKWLREEMPGYIKKRDRPLGRTIGKIMTKINKITSKKL